MYCLGLLCLASCDILIGKWYPDHDVAVWAIIRSVIAVGGVFCITGFDQMLMRERNANRQIVIILLIQVPVLAAIFAYVVKLFGISGGFLTLFAASAGGAISVALGSYFRSNLLNTVSQWTQQWWKIATLAVVIFAYTFGIEMGIERGTILAMTSSLFLLFLVAIWSPQKLQPQEIKSRKDLYAGGLRAMAMAVIMNLSMFGENLAVGSLSAPSDIAKYFVHFTYFSLPLSIVSGYAAFILAPLIRDRKELYREFVTKFGIHITFSCVVLFAGCLLAGVAGWAMIVGDDRTIDWTLAFGLVFNALLRTYYVPPAHYVALFFDNDAYDKTIRSHGISIISSLCLVMILVHCFEIYVLYAVILCSILNNLFRLYFTYYKTMEFDMRKSNSVLLSLQ